MMNRPLGGADLRAPWRNVALVGALVALAVSLMFFGWRAIDGYRDAEPANDKAAAGSGFGSSSERQELLAVTEEFATTFMTYGPDDLDEQQKLTAYRDRVAALITDKFEPSFQREAVVPEQLVVQGVRSVGSVKGAGVVAVSGDEATTLVSGEATPFLKKATFGDPTQFRLRVTLRKIDGAWLVDNFVRVEGNQQ